MPRVPRKGVYRKKFEFNKHHSNDSYHGKYRRNANNMEAKEHKFKDQKSGTFVLDEINLGIIDALVNNGDIKSADIAANLKVPLSTIQRRRSNLEKNSILRKSYSIDLKRLGIRVAEISLATKNGQSQKVIESFVNSYKLNILDMALRVGNPDTNVSFRVAYKNSRELFNMLEEIKSIEKVSMVHWSEYISENLNQTKSVYDLLNS